MQDIWTYLKTTDKPIVLYGMGNAGDRILDKLNSIGKRASGVFASDGFARHNIFRGYEVKTFAEITSELGTDIIVLISFGSALPQVMDNMKRISQVCETYAPCLSVVGDSYFDTEYYEANIGALRAIRDMLADDVSRNTLDGIVKYKLTGDIYYLTHCETPEDESWDIIAPREHDVYLDLGAYTGDTVKKYIARNPKYGKCIAVEPDKRSFRKMTANLEGLRDITLLHGAVSNYYGAGSFLNLGGRQSKIGDSGENSIIYTVDSILAGSRVDYINIDTEGEELNVLNGARNTISTYAPTMLVSAYHKATDIVDIPMLMHDIYPDYRVYMRHYPYIPDWDTVYIFKNNTK